MDNTTTLHSHYCIAEDTTPVLSHVMALSVAFAILISSAVITQSSVLSRLGDGARLVANSSIVNKTALEVGSTVSQEYVSVGDGTYLAVANALTAYQTLLTRAGDPAFALGVWSVDTFQTLPPAIDRMNLALGEFVIAATHSAIGADVALAYGLSDAAPIVARTTVVTLANVGGELALATARIPTLAANVFFAVTQAPVDLLTSYTPSVAHAQSDNTAIAKTYIISGDAPVTGDLVSFDPATQTFRLAKKTSDSSVFGVVVTNPVIILRTSANGVPLVNSGEAFVNVTTINGPISAGDYITSSSVPGKGQRADSSTSFVVGTALDAFPRSSTTTPATASTSVIYGGSIRVMFNIGPKSVVAEKPVATPGVVGPLSRGNATGVSAPVAMLIKYVLAAIVVAGTIYIAFRNFGSNMKDSIVSIGRNPLARASIQSMVVINTVLIVVVSVVGLFVGFMILFLPL